jgi:hypothetical protein
MIRACLRGTAIRASAPATRTSNARAAYQARNRGPVVPDPTLATRSACGSVRAAPGGCSSESDAPAREAASGKAFMPVARRTPGAGVATDWMGARSVASCTRTSARRRPARTLSPAVADDTADATTSSPPASAVGSAAVVAAGSSLRVGAAGPGCAAAAGCGAAGAGAGADGCAGCSTGWTGGAGCACCGGAAAAGGGVGSTTLGRSGRNASGST